MFFILNSLCCSIRKNLGNIDVYYDSKDLDLMDLEKGVNMSTVLHPAIQDNKSDYYIE